jgi:hypothetical protein
MVATCLEGDGDDEGRENGLQDDSHRVERLDLKEELGVRGAEEGNTGAREAGHLVRHLVGHQPERGEAPQDEEPGEACASGSRS